MQGSHRNAKLCRLQVAEQRGLTTRLKRRWELPFFFQSLLHELLHLVETIVKPAMQKQRNATLKSVKKLHFGKLRHIQSHAIQLAIVLRPSNRNQKMRRSLTHNTAPTWFSADHPFTRYKPRINTDHRFFRNFGSCSVCCSELRRASGSGPRPSRAPQSLLQNGTYLIHAIDYISEIWDQNQ
jgi:hypothetical protein